MPKSAYCSKKHSRPSKSIYYYLFIYLFIIHPGTILLLRDRKESYVSNGDDFGPFGHFRLVVCVQKYQKSTYTGLELQTEPDIKFLSPSVLEISLTQKRKCLISILDDFAHFGYFRLVICDQKIQKGTFTGLEL